MHTPAVGEGSSVRFLLADGESVQLGDGDLPQIYGALWDLEAEPGAVSTAALLLHEWRQGQVSRRDVELTPPQSDVFRQAMACRFTFGRAKT